VAVLARAEEVSDERLLGFYDRLRRRITRTLEKKGGRLGPGAARALLLVPDIFVFLVRLLRDPQVPGATRTAIGVTLAYFILPTDLLPEAVVGGAGFLDDLVLATAVLSHAFGDELEPWARKHWSGPESLRSVLQEVSHSAHTLIGARRAGGIKALLARMGLASPPPSDDE
jgi:uncharacterized membrane protein YkvA (DUF1232 family)